jgi:biopolymer transport protein ExbD
MITRPLDLASRLRRAPRSFDWVFLVNGGLIVLFFGIFGSRYVLSPGLGVDFELPRVDAGTLDIRPTTHVITVVSAGQIFAGDGVRNVHELRQWLLEQAHTAQHPSLLVRTKADVPAGLLANIVATARSAGFTVTWAADEPARNAAPEAPR